MKPTMWASCVFLYLLVPSTPAFRCTRNDCHVANCHVGPGMHSFASASMKPLVARNQATHRLGLESSGSSSTCPMAPNSNSMTTTPSASAADPATTASTTADSYHLIWSPHVRRKMLFTTPLLFLAKHAWTWAGMTAGAVSCHQVPWIHNWILPLLASSCCLLQLALNVVSVGCAGFNTYLGPVRPFFLSLFAVLLTSQLRRPAVWSASGISRALTRVTVAFLPELVHVFNAWRSQRRVTDLLQSTDVETINFGESSVLGPNAIRASVQLEIPTMGCVACINTIDGTLRRQASPRAQVVQAASALYPLGRKGGSATITVLAESEQALGEMIRQLQEATDRAGFGGATVASVRKEARNAEL